VTGFALLVTGSFSFQRLAISSIELFSISTRIMFQEKYHGWLIEILKDSDGYLFHCWLPGDRLAVSDRQIYPTLARISKVGDSALLRNLCSGKPQFGGVFDAGGIN
jgi:hypothetical protein